MSKRTAIGKEPFCGFFFYFRIGVFMLNTIKMKDNKDFMNLFKRGNYVCGKACVVYFRKNGSSVNKLGISTGKKTGNAVVRSRCRRIIRQAYRENEKSIPKGYDIIVVSRAGCGDCKSTDISGFFKRKLIAAMNNKDYSKKRRKK